MSEMVERVAIAMREANPGMVSPEAWPWRTMARAAIEAMREPTEGMVRAPYRLRASADDFTHRAFYQAMIDAALK